MATYLFFFRRTMIFDFDDPIYVHSFQKTKLFTKMADAVIVCTHGQAAWARQYNPHVHIIHIALDYEKYAAYTHVYDHEGPVKIGWVGTGPEHYKNLKMLAEVLERLLPTSPPFTFELVGAVGNTQVHQLFESISGLSCTIIDELDWADPTAVPRQLQTFDIGVLPHRSDGEWHASKTSLKNLEYMACGVATIVSDFGEMPYVMIEGTGMRARSIDEWVQKLHELIVDRALREQLGRAGQEHVRRHYSFEVIVPQIEEVLVRLGGLPSRLQP